MAPVPQEVNINVEREPSKQTGLDDAPLDDSAVVISGISALLPDCHNVMEFADKLYDKVNMVSSKNPRWTSSIPEASKYQGTIPNLDRFDAQFFMVFHKLSDSMDAMTRKLLEQSYQAVFDAGICPFELSGKSVGVFVSAGFAESEKTFLYNDLYFGIIGSNRAMYANRISYYLNLKGPSILVDSESSGSFVALEKAYQAIQSGQCEAALVGVAKLLLHPQFSFHYNRIVPANPDGKTKSYDMNADGQSVSEAFCKDGKECSELESEATKLSLHYIKIYASIRHIKTCFSKSTDPQMDQVFGPYRETAALNEFLSEFYNEAQIFPSSVEYVEGFGAALPESDKSELQSIEEVFCKERSKPLLVGSVMSNVGYTDTASGITAILKVLLAYQKGELAANINCESPRQDIQALRDGRMRILTEHHPFNRSYAAINNFSNTGINGHALLQGHYKPKNLLKYHSDIPHLVMVSGRQEKSVQTILDNLKGRTLDPEEIGLLHNIHKNRIPKHLARGFGIYAINKQKETVTLSEKVDYYDDARRPVWFVYSGMGSQWAGMGAQLMRIPVFADAVRRCHKVLEPKGVDIVHILTTPDKAIFDNILNSFVGIAVIQIGLTDVLRAIGLVPDKIIGHSVGELGCAYGDGCITSEEMILMAYSRGLVSIETPFIFGSMAAVGVGYKQISKMIPPEIEVACHNSPNSSTISGPAEIMREFVAKLVKQGIFAKEVPCSNIAYHSRYIAEAGPMLLKYLKEVVKTPKLRSDRWISTSVPEKKWNEPSAKYSSAEYHTNNLLNAVLFEEILHLVPHNAVLVEIAPHALLQAILKRSLSKGCHLIPLTRRGHENSAIFLLEAIGNLYMDGYDVDASSLYPKIEYPVSTETRTLSHLVEWAYFDKWRLTQYVNPERKHNAVFKPIISVFDEEYKYLTGNIIEGRTVLPFAAALVFVWDTLAMTVGKPREQMSVQFKDVTFHTQPLLRKQQLLYLTITLQRGSRRFEVTHEHGLVVDGYIATIANTTDIFTHNSDKEDDLMELTCADVYKLFHEKGYHYKENFRSIRSADMTMSRAQLQWKNNWVTFLDGLLQLNILRRPHCGIAQPQYIKRMEIDVFKHKHSVEYSFINATIDDIYNKTKCGGVVIEHIRFKDRIIIQNSTAMKELAFFPFFQENNTDVLTTSYVFLQIIAENLNKNTLNGVYMSYPNRPCILEKVRDLLNSPPPIKLNLEQINEKKDFDFKSKKPDFIFVHDLLSNQKFIEGLYHSIPPDTFIVSLGVETEDIYPAALYKQICAVGKGESRLELARWKTSNSLPATAVVSVRTDSDLEFLCATRADLPKQHKFLILAPYPPPPGLKDLVKQWRSDADRNQVFVAMINHKYDRDDDIENLPAFDLVFNILDNGSWGGEYFIPLHESSATGRDVLLRSSQLGDLNSLHWIEMPNISAPGIQVKVHFAGLNVYDAKRATAEISVKDSCTESFGMDFSGVTGRGERVMGLIQKGAASGKVIAQPELLWPVPEHWSLEDAATVPLSYALAFYCLSIKCRLIRGMNVLVHGGAGGLGQAAISIAINNGCKVFTTVSDIRKKELLRLIFPDLPDNHIGNSRDVTFKDMVMSATNGEGCHIIISSVKRDLKEYTLSCTAASGTTLDTVQIHNNDNYMYGMYNMTKSRSYIPIDFSSIFTNQKLEEMRQLQLLVSEGISRGYVRPLSRVTYSPHGVPRACRLLAASRHRGRVLLRLQEPVHAVQPRIDCSPKNCHLIICDEEGFGIQLADRLVSNGARKLYVHCPAMSAYLEFKKRSWQNLSVNVHISSENNNNNEFIRYLLKESNRLGPVEGIYIVTTGLTDDGMKNNVNSTVGYLDTASRDFCLSLRYFVVISDDYTIGHTVCVDRTRYGLPSTSLMLHNFEKYNDSDDSTGELERSTVLKWRTALDAVERAVQSKRPITIAFISPLSERSLLEEVADIPGVNIRSTTPDEETLENIGIDIGQAQKLCNILEDKFNIMLSKEIVPQMTVAMLKKLQAKLKDDKRELLGFSAYFNFIDSDELLANVDIISMRTLIQNYTLRADEFESDLTYLCIIPGLEAHHNRFGDLCERLKIPAIVLQPGFETVDCTIQDMAQRLVNVMMKRLKIEKHFYLLGYEFGLIVALEMAIILEKRGFTGTVFCMGGTPDDILTNLKTQIGVVSQEILQDSFINYMYTLMTGNKSEPLEKELNEAQSWNEKVEACVKLVRELVTYSKQYIQDLINANYARIMLARSYNWKPIQLHSKIVLLRSKFPKVANTESLNGCSHVVHELGTSLSYISKDLRCAAIVNAYLEPEILEDFYRRNHCETSLVYEEMLVTKTV